MLHRLNSAYIRLAAGLSAAVLVAGPAAAQTNGTDVQAIAHNMSDQLSAVPQTLSWMAYLCGVGLGMAGVFKLRQHVDNPTQVSVKDGLIRLGAGGALVALPVMLSAASNFATGGGEVEMTLPQLNGQ